MNITQTMPKVIPENTVEFWQELLMKRKEVYIGFAKIEEQSTGQPRQWASLATKPGQDIARNLWVRGFEEILEAIDSDSREHQLEELIDAFNFFLSLLLLDPAWNDEFNKSRFAEDFAAIEPKWDYMVGKDPSLFHFEYWLRQEVTRWFDLLRNRPWQNSIQSHYFDGQWETISMLRHFYSLMANYFKSWDEFISYYLAKEAVLIFRLETKY